ncbi:cobalt ECF transporter T component CbiQ [Desulfovibrio inopinatus]|uniref:cobalt ECF transporter T component CbiQ n=1 Tax=Desulfovibrio inopinatus TaxID=102109 RepID=UPI000403978B|nr:cobalt ECF transporter T component CbiQ [Desulfovibrio inopinatus]
MHDEPFAHGDSLFHSMDPRCKLVAALVFAVTVALLRTPFAAEVGFAVGLCLLISARLPLKPVAIRLITVSGFIAFLWVVVPFTASGTPIWSWGPLAVTDNGLQLASLVTLKSYAIIMGFIALVATSPVPDLGKAMISLHVPAKLCALLLFTYRYVFLISEEYQRLHTAARLRGFTPKTNRHTYTTYANMLAMTLVRSYNRSHRIHQAMMLRGFDGVFRSLRSFQLRPADILLLLIVTIASVVIVLVETGFQGNFL